ncbi:MAG: ABC transporter permease, partial [Ignavibacteria bacterium]|nr:ABC transporter permease [Ignavibacteria bacterium]
VGIVIGIFSIIVVMTAIGAIQRSIETTLNFLGSNSFVIQKYPAIQMGYHTRAKYRNRKDITYDQALELQKRATLPIAIGISADRFGRQVKYREYSTNPNVEINGVNAFVLQTFNLSVESGRAISNQDIEHSRMVCVIGKDLQETLFSTIDPIGQEIRFDGRSFMVIGVFAKRGGALGSGMDNFLMIPITSYQQIYGKDEDVDITVQAPSAELYKTTVDEVEGILRSIRKVPPHKENDFEIVSNESLLNQVNDITKYFKLGSAVVAFIALVAAGVGIMNLMLVSVTERTREIGIRKSVGATKKNVLSQFLLEAIVICQVGGIIGIILGVTGGAVISNLLEISAIIPIDWIIIGLLVCTFVGLIFGVYPAYKAANLDPIEALRYE